MTVKDFLLREDTPINLSAVAKAMWPTNKAARGYLDKKLHGSRPWTDRDTQLAKAVLKKLAVDIKSLE